MIGDNVYEPIALESSQEYLDYAKKELNEDPETSCQIIQELRDLIFERGECEPHRTDDAYLLRFLKVKHFVVKKAHRLIVNYYDFKLNNPAFIEGVNFKQLKHVADRNLISVYLLIQINMAEECLYTEWTSFPLRVQAVHVLNQPWLFDIIFNVFKPLLNKNMTGRIFVHGDNMESLHKYIDPKCLPKRYGGIHADYNCKDFLAAYESRKTIRMDLNSLGYDIDVDLPTDEC